MTGTPPGNHCGEDVHASGIWSETCCMWSHPYHDWRAGEKTSGEEPWEVTKLGTFCSCIFLFPVVFPLKYTFKMLFLCSLSPINHFVESQYRIKRQQEGEIFIKIKISKELLSEYFHCLWYLFSSKFLNIFNNSLNN